MNLRRITLILTGFAIIYWMCLGYGLINVTNHPFAIGLIYGGLTMSALISLALLVTRAIRDWWEDRMRWFDEHEDIVSGNY